MTEFMRIQKKRIEVDKWNEGCRIETDPGVDYIFYWIETYAADFRDAYEKSLCKQCYHIEECGHQVRQKCDKYF